MKRQTNHLLGYPEDARLLILNADDFGMCNSTNEAIKPARYVQLLRDLPAGLSEWAVHPGLDNAELLALEPANRHEHQTDFDFWTSQQAKDVLKETGIRLLDYRALQVLWKEKRFEAQA